METSRKRSIYQQKASVVNGRERYDEREIYDMMRKKMRVTNVEEPCDVQRSGARSEGRNARHSADASNWDRVVQHIMCTPTDAAEGGTKRGKDLFENDRNVQSGRPITNHKHVPSMCNERSYTYSSRLPAIGGDGLQVSRESMPSIADRTSSAMVSLDRIRASNRYAEEVQRECGYIPTDMNNNAMRVSNRRSPEDDGNGYCRGTFEPRNMYRGLVGSRRDVVAKLDTCIIKTVKLAVVDV